MMTWKRLKWYLEYIDIKKFLKYNYCSSNVLRDKNAFFYPMKGTKLEIEEGATLELHGNFTMGNNKVKGSKRETYLLLRKNSKLQINNEVTVNYGTLIQAHPNSKISIGKAIINSDDVIIAQKEIEIGNDVLIGRLVAIFDSDFHQIRDEEGKRANPPRKVTIGNHVWIGTKATILKGTTIKDGAVIAANTLVGGIVKANAMYSSMPGQMFGTIEWGNVKN